MEVEEIIDPVQAELQKNGWEQLKMMEHKKLL